MYTFTKKVHGTILVVMHVIFSKRSVCCVPGQLPVFRYFRGCINGNYALCHIYLLVCVQLKLAVPASPFYCCPIILRHQGLESIRGPWRCHTVQIQFIHGCVAERQYKPSSPHSHRLLTFHFATMWTVPSTNNPPNSQEWHDCMEVPNGRIILPLYLRSA